MMLRWMLALAVTLVVSAASAAPLRDQIEVRDNDGLVLATLVLCSDCKSPESAGKAPCDPGAPEGWCDGKPCGTCLMRSNNGVLVKYPYDIAVTGSLVDKDGKPVAGRFVKLFMPNGWGVRTRTNEKGGFRMMLGATIERKGKTPITVDIGQRRDSVGKGDEQFSMYLLQPGFAPCSEDQPDKPSAAPAAKKPAPASKPK